MSYLAFNRLFPTNPDDLEFIQVVRGSENLVENPFSLEDELKEAIQHSVKKQRRNANDELKVFSKEMLVYEANGKRNAYLKLLFEALEIISLTSVESDRVFSTAGLFVGNTRSRMSGYTLFPQFLFFIKKKKNLVYEILCFFLYFSGFTDIYR